MSYDYRDWPNIDVPKKSSSVREPSMPLGAEAQGTEVTVEQRGASLDFNNQPTSPEVLVNGCELWSLCIGRRVNIDSPIEQMMLELQSEGGESGALLKALAELQSIMRSLPAGTLPDEQVSIPAWHAVLLLKLAMRKLS